MKHVGLCKKIGYESKTRARRAQTLINHSEPYKLYVYKCPNCKFYHLTKQAQRNRKKLWIGKKALSSSTRRENEKSQKI